ncbi:MAG: phosphoenolpyruvate carboxykinase (ATP), partial [Algoriphagus sp.]|nr:phosphoenolpyruvate carboxykinase (ATP) [Algoriphagus sp.]
MQNTVLEPKISDLSFLNSQSERKVFFNLPPAMLIEHALARKEGFLTSTGALMADTGKFTGRSPKDRYIVKDDLTGTSIWWGEINIPLSEEQFDNLYLKMIRHLETKDLYVRDVFAGADEDYRLNIKVINTLAWHNLFCANMFLRPTEKELSDFEHDFTILCAPEFEA